MTNLRGATIEDFNRTVEKMRKVYPFKDKYTQIVDTMDYLAKGHTMLTLHTVHLLEGEEVYVDLQMEVRHEG